MKKRDEKWNVGKEIFGTRKKINKKTEREKCEKERDKKERRERKIEIGR